MSEGKEGNPGGSKNIWLSDQVIDGDSLHRREHKGSRGLEKTMMSSFVKMLSVQSP
jgi:hypothetical protein